jgi:hypothetical protein
VTNHASLKPGERSTYMNSRPMSVKGSADSTYLIRDRQGFSLQVGDIASVLPFAVAP